MNQAQDRTAKRMQVERNFQYHPPIDDAIDRHVGVREQGLEMALWIVDFVPVGREQSLALTALEEVVMWANAGIAREGK